MLEVTGSLGGAQSEHGQRDLNIMDPKRSIFKLLLYFIFRPRSRSPPDTLLFWDFALLFIKPDVL